MFSFNQLNSNSKLPSRGLVGNSVIASSAYHLAPGNTRIWVYVVPAEGTWVFTWSLAAWGRGVARGRDSIFPAEVLPPPQKAALLCGGSSSFKTHHGLIYSLDTKIQEVFKCSKSVLSLELSPWAPKHTQKELQNKSE